MYYIVLIALYILRENGINVPEGIIISSWIVWVASVFWMIIKAGEKK